MILLRDIRTTSKAQTVFIDLVSRKCHRFDVVLPGNFRGGLLRAKISYDAKRGKLLTITYCSYDMDHSVHHERFFIITINYLLANSILTLLSSESISIPLQRFIYSMGRGFPLAAVTCDPDDADNTDNGLCIWFDRQWRMESMTRWLEWYKSTKRGAAIMNAGADFASLDPPRWFQSGTDLASDVRPLRRMLTQPNSDEVLLTTDNDGVCRRWINVPPLMRVAAEKIFAARPDVKMAEVKKVTGVDLSNGIPDDGTEEDAEVLYLKDE